MSIGHRVATGVVLSIITTGAYAAAQTTAAARQPRALAQTPIVIEPPLPPATELEAFTAPPGSLLTVGHEHVGEVSGISVEVREMRNSLGQHVRGVVVTVPGGKTGVEQAFIDEDELPGLLKGFDTLLAITGNPTVLRNFETSYATKGDFVITAGTFRTSGIMYSVAAGRLARAEVGPLEVFQLHQLRTLIDGAAQRLATLPPSR